MARALKLRPSLSWIDRLFEVNRVRPRIARQAKTHPVPFSAPVSDARVLEAIAILARRIAQDVEGFGGCLEADRARGRRLRERLVSACRELLKLQRGLARRREALVTRKSRKIAAAIPPSGLRLHIGGGGERLPGWINLDLSPRADLPWNVLWGLPYPDGSVDLAFSAHTLEHLDYPHDALAFLREVRRVLRPAGVLRLVVPDAEKYFAAYARGDETFFRARRRIWPQSGKAGTPLAEALLYCGAGSYPEDFFGHKFGYDFDTLERLLRRAGFRRIARSAYMRSRQRLLRVDSASWYARAAVRSSHYSLFIEARI